MPTVRMLSAVDAGPCVQRHAAGTGFDPQVDPQHGARHALDSQKDMKNPAKRVYLAGYASSSAGAGYVFGMSYRDMKGVFLA